MQIKSNKILLLILILNFLLKSLWVLFMPHPPLSEQGDPEEYEILAWNVLHGNGYNLGGLTGHFAYFLKDRIDDPTMRRVPMYPLMIASIYFLVGRHYKAIFLAQALIDTLSCLIIYLLAARIFKDKTAGFAASILYITYIPFFETCHVIMSETLFIFLFYTAIYFLLISLETKKFLAIVVSGIIFGFAQLTRPSLLYAILLLLIVIMYYFKNNFKYGIKYSIILLCSFFFVISPWVLRNYLTFHKFFLTTTLEGENLSFEYLAQYSHFNQNPEKKLPFDQDINNSDEITRNNILKKRAIDYYLKNPHKWLYSIPNHLLIFWFGNYHNKKPLFLYYATTQKHHSLSISLLVQNILLFVLSMVSLIKCFNKEILQKSLPLLIIFLFFHFTETFTTPDQRHFIPLAPIMMIIGSYPISKFYKSKRVMKKR